jgi:phosphohistidine phosphatase
MTDDRGEGRTLVVLRHAKAEQGDGGPDIDRQLTGRGHADAQAAGAWLARQGLLPDVVICSPARRTRQTWHGVALGLAGEPAAEGTEGDPTADAAPAPVVRYEHQAYEATAAGLLALVRSTAPAATTVLLIAHNPGVSLLSARLDRVRADQDGLRTAGLVVHRTPIAWAGLDTGSAPISHRHTARA